MVKEVARALRSILLPVSEWADIFPAAQWALTTFFRERYRNTPYCVMFGRATRTAFSLAAFLHAAVAVSRQTKRKLAQGQAVLPKFALGDFVLYARIHKQGVTPKLMSTWTGPWRVVGADHAHEYSVQNIVPGAYTRPMPLVCVSMLTRTCISLRN
ncbi:unnamed protein product [Sphacelaria rigidula]